MLLVFIIPDCWVNVISLCYGSNGPTPAGFVNEPLFLKRSHRRKQRCGTMKEAVDRDVLLELKAVSAGA